MSRPVELIIGPARSGKASRILRAYLDAYADAGPGRCLMLVPTALRRRATESRLLAAQSAGVLVRPQVLTLPDLAERLLADAGRTVRRIGDLARRQIIRACLDRLDAKEAVLLGPLRRSPGLVEALDALFRELKAARIEPDTFGLALSGARLRSPRNRLLAGLYAGYQHTLQARDEYDDAGRFWHAAALAAEGKLEPFGDLALLAVDGFQDFAPAQLDLLEALSRRARRTLITLIFDPDRPKLFGLTARTRQRLRDRFGARLEETAIDAGAPVLRGPTKDEPGSGLPAGLERIRTHLFRLADAMPAPKADGSVRVIRAAGRTREVEEIARCICDLVRSGAAPASVAVLARSLEAYAPLVREIFPRYGLPFCVVKDRTLRECPIVRAAIALVRPQDEDYAFRAVARLLKSGYFAPEAFGADAATARAAVRLAREANVWKGRDAYFKGLDYLKGRIERKARTRDDSGELLLGPEERERRLEEIERVRSFLARLFEELALPEEATRAAFAGQFAQIIQAARLRQTAEADPDPERCARDLKALAALEEVLREVALLDSGDAEAPKIPRETFLDEVTSGLGLTSVPAEEPADAPVLVLDVFESRALGFDHIFILGLAEKEFPRRGRAHPFFDDAQRASLRRRGVDLRDTGHDAEHEMLLFYLAATRPRRTLTLGYPSLDPEGRPALASHYLDEVTGLFAPGTDGSGLPTTDVGTRDLDLPRRRVRSERELLTSALFTIWGPGETPDASLNLAAVEALLGRSDAAEAALAGQAVERERERSEAFGPFDGALGATDILEDLCRRFPGETVMSARRLEAFGGCPFVFFARHLLRLEPIEEPSPDLGPLDVGLIYHGLLERFYSALAASKTVDARLTEADREAALAILHQEADAYFKHLESHGRIGSPALWKIQKRNILRDLTRLVNWQIQRLGGWRPAYAEVWFGVPPGVSVEPPGRPEPLSLDGPHGPVRIRGRIDRIDLKADGGPGFQVIDYKSGTSAPTGSNMRAGTSFQLPIYLWAAEAILGSPLDSTAAEAFFLPVRSPRKSGHLTSTDSKGQPNEAFGDVLDRAKQYVSNFTEAMRKGRFPVWPRSRSACRNCDFQEICRYAEWRIMRKWEANPIAELALPADEAEEDEEGEP